MPGKILRDVWNKLTKADVWPLGFNLDEGFSDSQLEELAGPSHGPREGMPRFASPWLFFSSEMYSHGKTLRMFVKWPRILPIPVFSDHGVGPHPQLVGPELSNAANVHLTWSSWKADAQVKRDRNPISCVHPWVPYRRSLGLQQSKTAEGTLLFVPHSVPGHLFDSYDHRKYFVDVLKLDPELRPRAICIAMHDVNLGLHRSLRKFGLPIVSAGNSASPLFVDRFYSIVSRFSFATSPAWGTQTFICEEFGVKYFLFGEPPRRPKSLSAVPGHTTGDERRAFIDTVFRYLPGANLAQKRDVVESALNLNFHDEYMPRRIRRIFWRELILMMPHIVRQFIVHTRRQWL